MYADYLLTWGTVASFVFIHKNCLQIFLFRNLFVDENVDAATSINLLHLLPSDNWLLAFLFPPWRIRAWQWNMLILHLKSTQKLVELKKTAYIMVGFKNRSDRYDDVISYFKISRSANSRIQFTNLSIKWLDLYIERVKNKNVI